MKLSGQRNLAEKPRRTVRGNVICQHQGGWDARLDGMTNICELLINVVMSEKPKVLTGFNQKVRDGLRLLYLGVHGHQTSPANRQGLNHSCYAYGTW